MQVYKNDNVPESENNNNVSEPENNSKQDQLNCIMDEQSGGRSHNITLRDQKP